MDLTGKRILITGAAGGIGRLMALRVHAAGAHVIAWDLDEPGLARLATELGGLRIDTHPCDLAARDGIAAQAGRVLARHGAIDVLINNAGIVTGRSLLQARDEQIEATLAVNTLALFRTTRAFLPAMLERNAGTIVTISSAAGLAGVAGLTDYCASKWAAVGFDEALRAELHKRGSAVRTLIVCPYYIGTGMFAGVRTRFSWLLPILDPDHVARRIVDAIVAGRQRLLLPGFLWTTLLARLLPPMLFDPIVAFFGINASMDHFTGRPGADRTADRTAGDGRQSS